MSATRLVLTTTLSLLGLVLATSTLAQDGRREVLRDEAPLGSAPGFDAAIDPLPWQGLPFRPRRSVAPTGPLPGVAWAPGAPGSGGGTGWPVPFGIDTFEIVPLPCPEGAVSCLPVALNESGTRVAGSAKFEDHDPAGCGARARGRAVVWDLDDAGGVTRIHVLPNDVPADEVEYAHAQEVSDGGVVVGSTFHAFYAQQPGGPACTGGYRPSLWRQLGVDDWSKQDLPLPDLALNVPGGKHVTSDEWVIAKASLDLNGDGSFDDPDSGGVDGRQWYASIPDAGLPGGYLIEPLPLPAGFTDMEVADVSAAGVVAGHVEQVVADRPATSAAVWERAPSGAWEVIVLQTAGGDEAQAFGVDPDGTVFGTSQTAHTERFRRSEVMVEHAVSWSHDPVHGFWLAPQDLGRYESEIWQTRSLDSNASGLLVGGVNIDGYHRLVIWDRSQMVPLHERVETNLEFSSLYDVADGNRMLVRGSVDNAAGETVLLIPQLE